MCLALFRSNYYFIMSTFTVIDFQFITDNNHLFIKELAISEYQSYKFHVYLFHSPYPEWYLSNKSVIQNKFNEQNITEFDWNSGILPFYKIKNILNKYNDSRILVKGYEKKQILENYGLRNVRDLNRKIPRLNENNFNTIYCRAHKKVVRNHIRCALKNVLFIKSLISKLSIIELWDELTEEYE